MGFSGSGFPAEFQRMIRDSTPVRIDIAKMLLWGCLRDRLRISPTSSGDSTSPSDAATTDALGIEAVGRDGHGVM